MSDVRPIAGGEIVRVLAEGLAFVTFVSRDASGVFSVVKRARLMRNDPSARELLTLEGEVLARLDGRGAPRLIARGEDDFGPWIAMEFLEGVHLRGLRDARAAFGALAQIHEAGVLHGDITPRNVIVSTSHEHAWLVDFTPNVNAHGAFAGSLAFTAPEQARGETCDERADIFALAASIIATENDRAPREHGDLPLAVGAQLAQAAEHPLDESFIELAPPALARALAFDRAARPASARLVLAELRDR